jgi:hypothetical protein
LNFGEVHVEELFDEVLVSWMMLRGHSTPPVVGRRD